MKMTLARALTPNAIPDLTFCSRAGNMTNMHFLKMTQNDNKKWQHENDTARTLTPNTIPDLTFCQNLRSSWIEPKPKV